MTDERPEPDDARRTSLTPGPLLVVTADLTVVAANQAWLESAATTLEAAAGRHVSDVVPGDPEEAERPVVLPGSLERARDTRRTDVVPVRRYGSHDGRFWTHCTVPVLDERGDVVLLVHRADDVTESVRPRGNAPGDTAGTPETEALRQANADLRALVERQRDTARTLAELATTVSALSAAETRADLLRQVFRHGRPAFQADVLAVALLEPGGTSLAVVDTRSASGPSRPLSVHSSSPMAAAALGRPDFQQDASASGAGHAPLPGIRSWVTLPLRIGRRPLGSLTVGWERPRTLEAGDVQVVEAFAAQCAQALDRVSRRETERRHADTTRSLAETLQRSLLTGPPQLDDLDIAVRYRPAAREVQIGGDWYDAFLSSAGDVTVVVGDVSGHDCTAGAIAGQLRSMLRGVASALDHRGPERVLAGLDRALAESGIDTLATAVVARVEDPPAPAPEGHRVLRWSNAGHPPPLLVASDGRAALLTRPADLLLGVDPAAPRRPHTVALGPGDTVLLYTDGLVERRDATLDQGFDRLLALAGDLAGEPVHEFCDQVLARLQPELTDDIALLALRVREPGR